MSATDDVVSTRKISDLYVRGYKSDERVKLPAAYTRPGIPINRSHIPTPDTARQWPHLEEIAHHLTPLQDVEVTLLIGYNCAEALMPRDVVPSLNNEPYAQKSILGWGIVGMAENDDETRICHRAIGYPNTDILNIGRASVVCEFRAKEWISPSHLSSLVDHELNQPNDVTDTKISYEDHQFMKQMEAGIHEADDHHYETPLPFKQGNPYMSNNRPMAVKRRMQKDWKYHENTLPSWKT